MSLPDKGTIRMERLEVCFVDFWIAFDSVNHRLLEQKAKAFGNDAQRKTGQHKIFNW